MSRGKILIVGQSTGRVLGWFGEGDDSCRPDFEDIRLLELSPEAYVDEFKSFSGNMDDITVSNIDEKKLEFKEKPVEKTPEELEQERVNQALDAYTLELMEAGKI